MKKVAITNVYFVVLLSFLIFNTGYAAQLSSDLSLALIQADPTDKISVIVKFVDKINLKQHRFNNATLKRKTYRKNLLRSLKNKNFTRATIIEKFLKVNNIKSIQTLYLSNRLSAVIPIKLINEIADFPGVESIRINSVIWLAEPLAGSATTPEWNLDSVGVKTLWSLGYQGQGVVVANMDTGVDLSHPDLQSKWRGGTNSWFDTYGLYPQPTDPRGHGTQTMGVIVGGSVSGNNIGMAPDAKWIATRIFNSAGQTTLANIHAAFNWLMDPDSNPETDDLPDVVNASWGFATSPDVCIPDFEDDINKLKELGVAVVFSAGNSGPGLNTSLSPANNPGGYAVGAVNEAGDVASFSSRGSSPDCNVPVPNSNPPTTVTVSTTFPNVVAPGEMIKLADTSFGAGTALYTNLSGTSFAAPHVSGIMVLLKSAMPSVSVAELETVIEQTAVDIDLTGFDNNTGWGRVDAVGAFFLLPIDTDGDLVFDNADNCILVPNAAQIDTDNDGYGNYCDPDYNNDGVVNTGDLNIFRAALFSTDPNIDINGDGAVNSGDLNIVRNYVFLPPGPSAANLP